MDTFTLQPNSGILVFELGTPEITAASRSQDLVSILQGLQEDLRLVAKHGVNNPAFDFQELLDSGIPVEHIQAVCHAVRGGIYKSAQERSLDLDSL